jgi:hypothetical protein
MKKKLNKIQIKKKTVVLFDHNGLQQIKAGLDGAQSVSKCRPCSRSYECDF